MSKDRNPNRFKVYASTIQYDDWCRALTATYDETAAPKFIEKLIDRVKDSNAFKTLESFLGEIREFVTDLSNHIGLGVQEIALALSHKDIFSLFKAVGFNFLLIFKDITAALKILKGGLFKVFDVILKSGVLDDVKRGAARIDDVLEQYPIIKKLVGPALAGVLLIVWMNCSFTGHPDIDLDMSDIIAAIHGSYSIEEVFLSPAGLSMLALLCANLASGGSVSACAWLGKNAYNVLLALVYTGVLKNPKLKTLVADVKVKLPLSSFKVDNHAMKLAGA